MPEDTPNLRSVHSMTARRLLYRVRDWDTHFEVAQSKKVKGPLKWVALPCKHDGKSYRRLMREPNGAALYGAWSLVLSVAAKCPKRGTLADADGPLTAEDLELKTGCPATDFDAALSMLVELGWVTAETWPLPRKPADGNSEPTDDAPPVEGREPDVIVPAALGTLLDALVGLPPDVAPRAGPHELAELARVWEHVLKADAVALQRLHDTESFVDAVRRASFAHGKPWFSLAWLLKRERDGPSWNFCKLLDGAYADAGSSGAGRRSLGAIEDF